MKINPERRDKLVTVLSDVLNRLCERNDRFIVNTTPITRFHALRPPQITVKYYLQRIGKYSNCSEECFVLALIYIDRLIRTNTSFLVNSLNVHRLLITSMMLAAKFFDDQYFNNAYFGKVGGVTCKEINLLEIEFLFMINFNLFVAPGTFKTYNERLMMHSMPTESTEPQNHSPAATRVNNTVPAPAAPPANNPAPAAHQQHAAAPVAAPSSTTQLRNNAHSQGIPPPQDAQHQAAQRRTNNRGIPQDGRHQQGSPAEAKRDRHHVPNPQGQGRTPTGANETPTSPSEHNYNRNAPSQGKPVRGPNQQAQRARHHYGQRCTPPSDNQHGLRGSERVFTGQSR